ncbi:MAG: hypothetical protein LBG73_07840 [Spirochaetaceae bacterium]|jgi:hypothetical protein|nr:hypothetical protein [Spirochaetaceae bacterium]
MKKLFAVCIIGLALGTTSVFADHPSGWGVGAVFGGPSFYGWGILNYDNDHPQSYYRYYGSYFSLPFGVSLKMPFLPIYWKLGLNFGSNTYISNFGLSVTGDYYFIDKVLAEGAKLHWFLGAGGFFNFDSFTLKKSWSGLREDVSWANFELGARGVIGLSWQPIPLIEVFLNGVVALGIGFDTPFKSGGYEESGRFIFPTGGVGGELGIRFWF